MDATITKDEHAANVVEIYKVMRNSIILKPTQGGVSARISFGGALPVTVAIKSTEKEAYRSAARLIRGR